MLRLGDWLICRLARWCAFTGQVIYKQRSELQRLQAWRSGYSVLICGIFGTSVRDWYSVLVLGINTRAWLRLFVWSRSDPKVNWAGLFPIPSKTSVLRGVLGIYTFNLSHTITTSVNTSWFSGNIKDAAKSPSGMHVSTVCAAIISYFKV